MMVSETQAGRETRVDEPPTEWHALQSDEVGSRLGATVEGLSAHDLRHTWATLAARNGTPLERLQDAGGWNSLAMPSRYVEAARIANEGVRL